MDGVHDLGGMQGFGPVVREVAEPVFHEPWEAIVFGMTLAAMGQRLANIDEFRHAIERMDPAHYLSSSYYEHWLAALERVLVDKGIFSAQELRSRTEGHTSAESGEGAKHRDDAVVEGVRAMVRAGASSRRDEGPAPRFRPGDEVVVRKSHPAGHTRCPRYVRGARGRIERNWGSFILPDKNAHGISGLAEPCYSVRFDASELWGSDAESTGHVYVDLWESYLHPARPAAKRSTKRIRS